MGEEYNYNYFINRDGALECVTCAFKVICLKDTHILSQGDIVLVASVIHTNRGIIIYNIRGELYYHHHFDLYPLNQLYSS